MGQDGRKSEEVAVARQNLAPESKHASTVEALHTALGGPMFAKTTVKQARRTPALDVNSGSFPPLSATAARAPRGLAWDGPVPWRAAGTQRALD